MLKISLYPFISFLLSIYQFHDIINAQESNWDAEYSSDVVLDVGKAGSEATYFKKAKYVILNEDGLKFCNLAFPYGFNSKITNISASIKSTDGKVLKNLKNSDITDRSAQPRGALYVDTRIKEFFLGYTDYPFILEYELKKKYDETFIFPSYIPEMGYKLFNLRSSFKLITHGVNQVNVYERSIEEARITKQGNKIVYEWVVDSLHPLTYEPFSYREDWDAPRVELAPAEFHLEHEGSNNSWIEFGNWIYRLNQGRGDLTLEEMKNIDSILVDASTNFQKIDLLYRYLQTNTRYVSIQQGIGGWQPFTAEFVCNNKYGDCKALTNYMLALLKYAGIKSFYTLVKGGTRTQDIVTGFPSNQFNHAILMVPNESDTIWLDCTSQLNPTGFIDAFIADRHVLVIDWNNSHLLKIPTYDTLQNIDVFNGIIRINTDLSGSGEISFTRYAHRSSGSRSIHKYYNTQTAKKYLDNWLKLPSYSTKSITHTEKVRNFIPYSIDSISFHVNVAGKKAGPDLLISYPLDFRIAEFDNNVRSTDIYLPDSYKRTDSLVYILPGGYELTNPISIKHNSEYGNFSCKVSATCNQIILVTSFSIIKGRYPRDQIRSFQEYISSINKIESYEIIASKFK